MKKRISNDDKNKISEIVKKRVHFNLAVLYLANNKFMLAKASLDTVKNSSLAYEKRQELAELYESLGDSLRDAEHTMHRLEAYQSAADCYSKLKSWHAYCKIQLTVANLYFENKRSYEAMQTIEKTETACFYLKEKSKSDTNNQLAEIYCDLSTMYAKDTFNVSNVYHAKQLLNKALDLVDNSENLTLIVIYLNLSAVNNRIALYDQSLEAINKAYDLIGDGKILIFLFTFSFKIE